MAAALERVPDTSLGRLLAHRTVGLVLVAATCVPAFWFNLDGTTLWDPDEGRHASIARELLARGEYLTPTLNGRPYHDKPILFYWLAALSLQTFGSEAWAARVPSALAASIAVLATACWGMRFLGPLTGTLAGMILATAGLWVGLGRLAMLDMLFSVWMSLALLYGSAWVFAGRASGWPPWPIYVALALATLTKGPAAPVLAAMIFIVLTYRTRTPWLAWRPLHGAALFALVAGAWFVSAAVVSPEYVHEFVWTHNVSRFTTGSVGHPLNFFAYVYWLPTTFLPWSLFWPGAAHALYTRRVRELPPAVEFCCVWVLVVFVFFTVSAAKLATYMLPIFPPLALLTAVAVREAFYAEQPPAMRVLGYRVAFHALQILAVGLFIAAFVMGYLFWPDAILRGVVPVLLVMPPPLLLGHLALRSGRPSLLVPTTFVLMVCLLFGFYGWFAPWLNDVFSLGSPARLARHLPPDRRVFTVDTPPGSLAFYLEQPVERLPTLNDAAARLAEAAPTAILTKTKRLPELATLVAGPAYVWWESPRIKVLVTNRPPPEGSGIEGKLLRR